MRDIQRASGSFVQKMAMSCHLIALREHFTAFLKRAGIEKTGIHSLRHTFASNLFARGVDVKTVSHLLGHSSVKITYDTYIHLIKGVDHEAVAVLDEA